MGAAEVQAFLTALAVEGHVSASTQAQALAALLFLYKVVLGINLPWLDEVVRAKRPQRLPTVLRPEEVSALLAQLEGTQGLMGSLLYGTGMRLMECLRLRIKDVDLARREITIREGKGNKDRHTMLSLTLLQPLSAQIEVAKTQWQRDAEAGLSGVYLPDALDRKKPGEERLLTWYWLFPAREVSRDPRSDVVRRHHAHEQGIQRAVRRAVLAARINKPASLLAIWLFGVETVVLYILLISSTRSPIFPSSGTRMTRYARCFATNTIAIKPSRPPVYRVRF